MFSLVVLEAKTFFVSNSGFLSSPPVKPFLEVIRPYTLYKFNEHLNGTWLLSTLHLSDLIYASNISNVVYMLTLLITIRN